jgi:hypothetical protein
MELNDADIQMSLNNGLRQKIVGIEEQLNQQKEQLDMVCKFVADIKTDNKPSSKVHHHEATTPKARPVRKHVIKGTKADCGNIKIVMPKFWFHLSPFEVTTTEDEVKKFVRDMLKIEEDVYAKKLLPKSIEQDKLEFISFKIGVPEKYQDCVLDGDTWPKGLRIRKFETQSPIFPKRRVFDIKKIRQLDPFAAKNDHQDLQGSQPALMEMSPMT